MTKFLFVLYLTKILLLKYNEVEVKKTFELIGQRIKKLRQKKGWTQKELASRLRIDQRYVDSLESGYQKPSNVICFALSDLFRVPVTDIYPDIEIPFEKQGREFLKE